MKSKAICTTTINTATEALERFSKMEGWDLIVATDVNSEPFHLENTIILTPEEQMLLAPELSAAIGFRNIQRRNFATLYALRNDYDFLAFVDDDNIPNSKWNSEASNFKARDLDLYITQSSIFDPLSVVPETSRAGVSHRGFPDFDSRTKENNNIHCEQLSNFVPDVIAMLWDGDWDVNAISRQNKATSGTLTVKNQFKSNCWSPFNSQNTVMTNAAAREFFMFPGIGRYDDILASYWVQSRGYSVIYTGSTVTQIRNVHNLEKDIKNEKWGHENIYDVILELKSGKHITEINSLPKIARHSFELWQNAIVQ